MILGSAIWGSNVADIFGGPQYRSIFVDWLLGEISGTWGPPYDPKKYSEMMFLPSKKPQMGIFSILSVENRVLERWGGAVQLWAGKKLCSPNKSKITQKKISDRAHPLPCEIGPSKMPVLTNRKSQN